MPTAPTETAAHITGEALAQMSDLGPCELVEGKIVPMSPTSWHHGKYVSRLDSALRHFVEEHDIGHVLAGEVGIFTARDPDTVRGADVAFISHERLAAVTSQSFLDVAPELIVEVVSPANTWQEMRQKIDEYFGAGADVVWVVEPERRKVLVYRGADTLTVLRDDDVLEGEAVLEGFALPLSELFE